MLSMPSLRRRYFLSQQAAIDYVQQHYAGAYAITVYGVGEATLTNCCGNLGGTILRDGLVPGR